jgi:hypothetical protein
LPERRLRSRKQRSQFGSIVDESGERNVFTERPLGALRESAADARSNHGQANVDASIQHEPRLLDGTSTCLDGTSLQTQRISIRPDVSRSGDMKSSREIVLMMTSRVLFLSDFHSSSKWYSVTEDPVGMSAHAFRRMGYEPGK